MEKEIQKARDFRKPYQEKWLRMAYLYRAYRDKTNYAYNTNLMPPIAFEIVETVKPRLAAAKVNVRILPRFKKDVKSKSLESWDDLIKHNLDTIEFSDKKIDLINSTLEFGDGVAQLTWGTSKDDEDNGAPFLVIQDLWLFYPDPEATDLQKDSRYEIQLSYKTKGQLEKEEKKRGNNKIYSNLDKVQNKKITDDPRKERYEINTKKMGQIAKGGEKEGTKSEEKITEEKLEILQIWDHEEGKLLVIVNQEELIRYDDNPYKNVNNGRTFLKLSDHAVLWELWSIGHIEPVETTIIEIADSRNQAMDDIVFTLDPVRKLRKKAHLVADDIKYKPGAVWELDNVDDVVTEKPPEISKQWIEKDNLLRKEIQSSLAISEYATGLPKSKQEPMGKVELLLMQTNIRFSLLVRQLGIVTTRLVNNLIELNQEFLTKEKAYRLVGKEIDFKEFTQKDKKIKVDARVEIEPKPYRTPEQRKDEALLLYKIFVAEDKPDLNDAESVKKWKTRKRTLQKLILEECDKSQYEDLLLEEEEEEKESRPEPKPKALKPVVLPPREPEPILPSEEVLMPEGKIPLIKKIAQRSKKQII